VRPVYDANGVYMEDYYDENQRNSFQQPAGPFPLVGCEWSITHNMITWQYNCVAWSVDENNFWYNPDFIDRMYGNPPNGNGIFDDSDMDDFYLSKKGWVPITSGSDEQKAGQAQAMYYSYGVAWNYIINPNPPGPGFHAAGRTDCNSGAGKWIMYESKCGEGERIEHVWNQLNGSFYNNPSRFYKATLPGQATNPSPANGATNVSITADLSWTAGSGATSHDVYFGTSSPGTSSSIAGPTGPTTGSSCAISAWP